MAEVEEDKGRGDDEGFTSLSQTMKDISQTFEESKGSKDDHGSVAQENIHSLVRYQGWLKNIQQMQSGFIQSRRDPATPTEEREHVDDLTSRIAGLQEELMEESMKHGVKELTVRSAQLANKLQELLFPREPDAEPEQEEEEVEVEGDEEAKKKMKRWWARDLCDKQRSLASDILAHHHASREVQEEIDDRKQKIRDLQASNVELMRRLQALEGDERNNVAPSRTVQKAQNELDNLISQIIMERGILQGLVIGSGVNWAKDEHLREVVLGLGKPLELDQ